MATIRFAPDYSPFSFDEIKNQLGQSSIDQSDLDQVNQLSLPKDILNSKLEYIFILDRSGSMYGDRIQYLKEATKKIITNLPEEAYFNILCFGTEFEQMFPES